MLSGLIVLGCDNVTISIVNRGTSLVEKKLRINNKNYSIGNHIKYASHGIKVITKKTFISSIVGLIYGNTINIDELYLQRTIKNISRYNIHITVNSKKPIKFPKESLVGKFLYKKDDIMDAKDYIKTFKEDILSKYDIIFISSKLYYKYTTREIRKRYINLIHLH